MLLEKVKQIYEASECWSHWRLFILHKVVRKLTFEQSGCSEMDEDESGRREQRCSWGIRLSRVLKAVKNLGFCLVTKEVFRGK